LVYSLYIATIATPVNKKKTKKVKKNSPGQGASSGEENEQLFGFRPGAKKMAARGKPTKPVLPAGQRHMLHFQPFELNPDTGQPEAYLFWLRGPSRCDSRYHRQGKDRNDPCVDEE